MSIPHQITSDETDSRNPTSATTATRLSIAGSRLRKHGDYQRVYESSRKRQSASMSWFLARQQEPDAARVGITAGKVLGKSHERNRIKRRMREILRRHVDLLPAGFDLVLHPRRQVLTAEFTKLDDEVVRILGQARTEAARNANAAPHKPIA